MSEQQSTTTTNNARKQKQPLNTSSCSTASSSSQQQYMNPDVKQIVHWNTDGVSKWLKTIGYESCCVNFKEQKINGRALLMLNEDDLREIIKHNVGQRKNLFHLIRTIQIKHSRYVSKSESRSFFEDTSDEEEDDMNEFHNSCEDMNDEDTADAGSDAYEMTTTTPDNRSTTAEENSPSLKRRGSKSKTSRGSKRKDQLPKSSSGFNHHHTSSQNENDMVTPSKSNMCINCLKKIDNSPYTHFEQTGFGVVPLKSYRGEKRKTMAGMVYLFFTGLWTSFMLTVVHDRVPDMNKYPPLPDMILDNVPLMPWAFFATEIIGLVLLMITFLILFFHKYRLIIFRRICSLGGTIFILRSITMLITSLSVPGIHIQCSSQKYGSLWNKLAGAWNILSGVGLYVHGVRTCGDYMFSGHTVWLTLLSHFITEYTPASGLMRLVHTAVWVMNAFGLFFILGAHEHYSIDVFVAFYITSRMFLYYHSLANNRVLFQHDHKKIKIWFPLFSYFESNIHARVPNEYQNPFKSLPKYVKNRFLKPLWSFVTGGNGNGGAATNTSKPVNNMHSNGRPHSKSKIN